jgi:hypothetical protein
MCVTVGRLGWCVACVCVVNAALATAAIADQERWELGLAPEQWQARPDRVSASRRAAVHRVERSDGLTFSVQGPVSESRGMRWSTRWSGDLARYPYVVLEYRARWLHRMGKQQDAVSALVEMAAGRRQSVPLVLVSELIDDGQWHQLTVRRPLPDRVREILVTLDSRDSRGEFSIRRMRCTASLADCRPALETEPGVRSPADSIAPVDLAGRYNAGYDALVERLLGRVDDPVAQDAGRYFTEPRVRVEGIPFHVRPQANNLVGPPPKSTVNDEWIDNFGLRVRRGQVAPISRDDPTEIAVDRPATELYLLLAAEMPSKQKAYFVGDRPKALTDVESFAVELRYADGTVDHAFPYSLSDRRHVIQRTLAAYAVPATGQTLKSIVLRNRSLMADVYLAALSVNTGPERLCPQVAERAPTAAPPVKQADARAPYARREGNLIHLGNAHLDLTLDAGNALAIRRLVHRRLGAEAIQVAGDAGLEITVGGTKLAPHEMRLVDVEPCPGGFDLFYSSTSEKIPLDWRVRASVDSAPEVRLGLTVTNRSAVELQAGLRFPIVGGLRMGKAEELWYMFPQYCNALDNRPTSLCTAAGFLFPMQFMDLFNPQLGGGVLLATEDRSHKLQRYGLVKNDRGGSLFVEYPATFTHLAPGKPYACCETLLGVHLGDWHAAADRYRRWVSTWYRPYKSQDKQWYREAFWLLAEIADGLEPDTYRLPAWYDATTKHHRMRDILAEFERVAGRKPDILHFWSWAYSEAEKNQRWGEYGGPDYEALGGLPAWRAALDDVQQNLKIPVSLYINATLCNRFTPVGQRLGPQYAMQLPDGRPMIPYPNSYRMCHATPQWTEYMQQLYRRLARETGVPILYVDETASRAVCYCKDHGHSVPMNCNEADYGFLKAVREATPGHIALYGEYPNVDVASQYSDCNINYYFLTAGQQLFCPTYDDLPARHGLSPMPLNVYRYLFPRIVQLDLPLGMRHASWHELKLTFFHGEAIYDSYWDRDESKGHAFMVRAYDLKRRYKDCFTSDRPEMLVPSERFGLAANRFPGQGRTLWTLYNRRYTTLRGPALRVEHFDGATYRDAWHDRALTPEIRGKTALMSLTLDPQEIGCVVQERKTLETNR